MTQATAYHSRGSGYDSEFGERAERGRGALTSEGSVTRAGLMSSVSGVLPKKQFEVLAVVGSGVMVVVGWMVEAAVKWAVGWLIDAILKVKLGG
jgi:hypothetical protein